VGVLRDKLQCCIHHPAHSKGRGKHPCVCVCVPVWKYEWVSLETSCSAASITLHTARGGASTPVCVCVCLCGNMSGCPQRQTAVLHPSPCTQQGEGQARLCVCVPVWKYEWVSLETSCSAASITLHTARGGASTPVCACVAVVV